MLAIEDRVSLLVDGDTPVVVIDSPARAAMIQGTPGQAITISGHVSDPTSGVVLTGAAIIISCATALIGFGTLINSSYGPLHVFGIVSIVTPTTCVARVAAVCRPMRSKRTSAYLSLV